MNITLTDPFDGGTLKLLSDDGQTMEVRAQIPEADAYDFDFKRADMEKLYDELGQALGKNPADSPVPLLGRVELVLKGSP
jgi:hypothetical protein